MQPEEVTGQDTGQEQVESSVAPETGGGDSTNPAWSELLSVVPEMLHSQVTPHLEKWDKNYQEGINKVHSQYESYKPYLENNISPDQINYALQLVNAIDERPADVISALQEYHNLQNGGGQQEPQAGEQGQVGETEIPEFINHPEFQKMNKMVETMAQLLVQQNYSQKEAEEDQALSQELDELHAKHGDYDEEWVLTRAANNPNIPLEQHVEAYKEFETRIRTESRRPPGPKVMGAGGIAPDNQVDPKSLDDKGRRSMVAQILASAAQNND